MNRKRIIVALKNFFKPLKWFYPGMKVKRWFFLSFIGIILIVAGGQFLSGSTAAFRMVGIGYMFIGIAIVILGIKNMLGSFIAVFMPQHKKTLVDIVYEQRHLSRGYRIAVIGGGTGLSVLLAGLKQYTNNITAIVTVTDEGGSSGVLREEFDVLPPGDIRNCLVALADTEPLMSDLFQYRFKDTSTLGGHNFGNLFLLAMSKVTKDFEEAVKESSKVLAVRGQVVPSTLNKVRLMAEFDDGSKELGEVHITEKVKPIKRIWLNPSDTKPTGSSLEAIENADAIVLGPGSLYTSVIPNLLIDGISGAIRKSNAPKIYICNIMTQHGETDNYKASDHLKAILENTKIGSIDYCVVNKSKIPEELLKKYEEQYAYPVEPDVSDIRKMNVKAVESSLVHTADYIRHNSKQLAKTIIDAVSLDRAERIHPTSI